MENKPNNKDNKKRIEDSQNYLLHKIVTPKPSSSEADLFNIEGKTINEDMMSELLDSLVNSKIFKNKDAENIGNIVDSEIEFIQKIKNDQKALKKNISIFRKEIAKLQNEIDEVTEKLKKIKVRNVEDLKEKLHLKEKLVADKDKFYLLEIFISELISNLPASEIPDTEEIGETIGFSKN